jgi:hypothetical protein
MSGAQIVVAPIVELDISKNEIALNTATSRALLCKILTSKEAHMSWLSIRDNLIRDEAADLIRLSLQGNLSILKFQIDMNPIKHATVKEIESIIKRNVQAHKEK